jgi:hypothetical protein
VGVGRCVRPARGGRGRVVAGSWEIEDVGWDTALERFVDLEEAPIAAMFKAILAILWEPHTMWIEPLWKTLLSSRRPARCGLRPALSPGEPVSSPDGPLSCGGSSSGPTFGSSSSLRSGLCPIVPAGPTSQAVCHSTWRFIRDRANSRAGAETWATASVDVRDDLAAFLTATSDDTWL